MFSRKDAFHKWLLEKIKKLDGSITSGRSEGVMKLVHESAKDILSEVERVYKLFKKTGNVPPDNDFPDEQN
jgi:hypothetical protein